MNPFLLQVFLICGGWGRLIRTPVAGVSYEVSIETKMFSFIYIIYRNKLAAWIYGYRLTKILITTRTSH